MRQLNQSGCTQPGLTCAAEHVQRGMQPAQHSAACTAQHSAARLNEVVLNECGAQQQRPAVAQVLLRCN